MKYHRMLYLLGVAFMCSCSGLGKLKEDQKLYDGARIEIKNIGDFDDDRPIEADLQKVLKPKPNQKFLFMRPKLAFYNLLGPGKKEKGLRKKLVNLLGEPPVLYNDVEPENVKDLLFNRLHNKGYFDADVSYTVEEKKKTAAVNFLITLSKPYDIKNIFWPDSSRSIDTALAGVRKQSLLKVKEPYDLDVIKAERLRIEEALKEKGYYFFNPDFLLYRIDTTQGNRSLNIHAVIKEDAPAKGLMPYRIGETTIHSGYLISKDTLVPKDTLKVEGYNYIDIDGKFKPKSIVSNVFFKKDSLYQRSVHNNTLARLNSLGSLKFVNVRFIEDTSQPYTLEPHVYLSAAKKKSIRLEGKLVSKSNNFAGPGATLSFRNRNLLKGSELLTFDIVSSFETQQSGNSQFGNYTSYELGLQSELQIPRLFSPVKFRGNVPRVAPRTRIRSGFRMLNRVQFFSLNSVNASYGYAWRMRGLHEIDFNPISINYINVTNVTPAFRELLRNNLLLQNSFQQQYILGGTASYSYNNQPVAGIKRPIYFNFNADGSGNLLGLIFRNGGAGGLLKDGFAQYGRFDFDFRKYFKRRDEIKFATRVIAGIGLPYGNSYQLPYIKQFYTGGPNSIRAFRARSIGPGTYNNPVVAENRLAFDQTGDIKFEGSAELRFPLMAFIKGAVFLDAGNVWLLNPDPLRPGGQFKPTSLVNELAIGTGYGIRFDFSLFVVRFDFAFPLKKPYEAGMVPFDINNLSPLGWVGETDMILNIGVGYPF